MTMLVVHHFQLVRDGRTGFTVNVTSMTSNLFTFKKIQIYYVKLKQLIAVVIYPQRTCF